MNFPPNWPMYLPKDMLAKFLEDYAAKLDLDVRTGCEVVHGKYTGDSWVVEVRDSEGVIRTMRPRFVVMATGVTGSVPKYPDIEGSDLFEGTILHSSEYLGTEEVGGRRAVVIGAGTSGHDIAQDLYHRGASSITMVQRSSITVISLKASEVQYAIYRDAAPEETMDDLDFVSSSIPNLLARKLWISITKRTSEQDKALLDGLHQVGFLTDQGEDESGFVIKSLMTYAGFYIDVGASQLIADGKVQIRSGVSMSRLAADEVILTDGTALKADLVILSTGFNTMQEEIRDLFGHEVAERVGPVWGMSEDDGELRAVWGPTAQPYFLVMGGGLAACRTYSRYVALQIQAGLQGRIPYADL